MPGPAKSASTKSLVAQRAVELRHQKQALEDEFTYWRDLAQPNGRMEKHQSQICSITEQLEGFLDKLPWQAATDYKTNEKLYRRLLGAHRIWAFFRGKLALREVASLRDYLLCTDELAWACYEPARNAAKAAGRIAGEALKEPPLVFFSSDATPYIQARAMAYAPEGITARDLVDLGAALLTLPIPVIGVPWFQVAHLPQAVTIGHEVGHAVEQDFGLRGQVEAMIKGLALPAARAPAWLAWCHELFADVYGVLCTGPAAVLALADYFIDEPDVICKERLPRPGQDAPWGDYPTRTLRLYFNLELLNQGGLADEGLAQTWQVTYPYHAMPDFDADMPIVVTAFRETVWRAFGLTLPQMLAFGPADVTAIEPAIYDINHGYKLQTQRSFRHLFAAATLAYYRDPDAYALQHAHMLLLERMLAAIPKGVRSAEGTQTPAQAAAKTAANRAAGAKLMDLFD